MYSFTLAEQVASTFTGTGGLVVLVLMVLELVVLTVLMVERVVHMVLVLIVLVLMILVVMVLIVVVQLHLFTASFLNFRTGSQILGSSTLNSSMFSHAGKLLHPYTAERRDVLGCTMYIWRAEGNLKVGRDVQPITY